MPFTSAQAIFSKLQALGPAKFAQAKWTVAPVKQSEGAGVPIVGPAFQYLLLGPDEISISYVGDGHHLFPVAEDDQRFIIEFGGGRIRFRADDRNYHSMASLPSLCCEHLQQISTESSDAHSASGQPSWVTHLSLIQGAMKLMTCVYDLTQNTTSRGKQSLKGHKVTQICNSLGDWLGQNISESLYIEDTAKELGLSSRQLIRHLKNATNLGYAEHVLTRRLIEARRLLMNSSFSVLEIATKSGFTSREQLIRSFNRFFGWTPLQFRKSWMQLSRSHDSLTSLCQMLERQEAAWMYNTPPQGSPKDNTTNPQTLIVSNACQEMVELFWLTPSAKAIRMAILDRGSMVFYMRDHAGSSWQVRGLSSQKSCSFITQVGHSIATITPDRLG